MEQIRCVWRILDSTCNQPQTPQPSFLQAWNLSIFFEAHAFHSSLGFCSPWTHFVSIFKGLWKKRSLTFLVLCMIPQSFVPLPDGIRFLGSLFVTSMYLMKGKGTDLDLSHSSVPAGVLDCSPLLGSKMTQRSLRNKISPRRAARHFFPCFSSGVYSSPHPSIPQQHKSSGLTWGNLLLQGHALKAGTHPHVLESAPSCNKSKSTPELPWEIPASQKKRKPLNL